MDVEEEMLVFGESEVWVQRNLCRASYGDPGLDKEIVVAEHVNVCADCLRKQALLQVVNAAISEQRVAS